MGFTLSNMSDVNLPDTLLPADEFLRMFPMRCQKLMWFLGAGASASAGIKTAYSMIWDFKREIYCSRNKISLRACTDLSSQIVRRKIQSYFDSLPDAPAMDSDEEYSYYFKTAWRTESDRRAYIEQAVKGAKPSYGHLALASLAKIDHLRHIWTTNFDSLLEDATATVFGSTSDLTVASLDSPNLAQEAIDSQRHPLLVKIHGDFRSNDLKNTEPELKSQNSILEQVLIESLQNLGLCVIGYSGRDQSVMAAFKRAMDDDRRAFRSGFFWFYRSSSPVLPEVQELIKYARSKNIEAYLIEADTFDELMSDIVMLTPGLPSEIETLLDAKRERVTTHRPVNKSGNYPLLRFNAFPIVNFPSVCRLIDCGIDGASAVKEAVEKSGLPIVAGRRNVGVIAFGGDSDCRSCFNEFSITQFDLHKISFHRLEYDSAEHGLLAEALWLACGRESKVIPIARGRSRWLTVDPEKLRDPSYAKMATVIPKPVGQTKISQTPYREGVQLRLAAASGQLWLVLQPSIFFDYPDGQPLPDDAKEFARERSARRYNKNWNGIYDAWSSIIFQEESVKSFRALGCQTGVDAEFTIGSISGYSARGQK